MIIDLTKTYKVEPKIAYGDAQGLDKNGLSRHVGTIKSFSVSYNDITGKYKTGLDENASEVISLPTAEREKKIEWIKSTKEHLEKLIGQEGILNPRNDDFWALWKVDIEVGLDKKIRLFGSHPFFQPNLYWEHALALITLDANESLPMSKKDWGNPKYKDAQFGITTTEEETTMSKEKVKKNKERSKIMSLLFDEGKGQYEKAARIAYLLGVQKEHVGVEKLEEVLEIFSVQPEYMDKFIALAKMEDDELELRATIRKAIENDIIKFNSADRVFFRGGFNMRETEDSTVQFFLSNLVDPVVGRELVEIKAAVAKRESKKKQKTLV